jgi:pimeloyl-ACP methyl ester carboxylesterase
VSSWSWRRVAWLLSERFTVYVFDLLGFGASDKHPGQDVSLAGHGQRFAALLDSWGLERPAVVAHDIGGATALRAHLLNHRPVAALALIDVVALAPWARPSTG